MRLRLATVRRRVKGDLRVEFVPQELTSYSGLELLRRYFALLDLHRRIRHAFTAYGLAGDYGCGRRVLLVIAVLVVGGRRLEHLRDIAHDPLVERLCGLARLPSDRTVANGLKQFTQASLQALITLNSTLLYEQSERLNLSRLTMDVDGTVVRTGGTVAWAFRGFNPHHRKDPSYTIRGWRIWRRRARSCGGVTGRATSMTVGAPRPLCGSWSRSCAVGSGGRCRGNSAWTRPSSSRRS